MILIDSSVWIDYVNSVSDARTRFLDDKLDSGEATTCHVIIQEVLQGIKNEDFFSEMKSLMLSLPLCRPDGEVLCLKAVDIFRQLRCKGVTIRKPNDCLIASCAILEDMSLLHNDRDFDRIADLTELAVVSVSP